MSARAPPPPAPPARIAHGDHSVVHLSPHVAATLWQIAAHDGLTVSQTLDRLIAERAMAIGLPSLSRSVSSGGQSTAREGRGWSL